MFQQRLDITHADVRFHGITSDLKFVGADTINLPSYFIVLQLVEKAAFAAKSCEIFSSSHPLADIVNPTFAQVFINAGYIVSLRKARSLLFQTENQNAL